MSLHISNNQPFMRLTDCSYSFNGKEQDSEGMGGAQSTYDYGFRIYNQAIARFLSVDPLTKSYPWYTPYQFAGNKPIWAVDLDGLEEYYATDGSYIGNVGGNTEIRIVDVSDVDNAAFLISKANSHDEKTAKGYTQVMINRSTSFTDYAENVSDVLNNATLETWADNNENCYDAACAQMDNAGQAMENKYQAIQTDVDNSNQPSNEQLSENSIGGAIYIMTQLKKGNPVMVGVKETATDGSVVDVNNYNQNTGHFVVISSMQKNNNLVSFGYYDNANGATGKSSDNKFNVNSQTGEATDNTNVGVVGVQSYKVSEVRKNK